jgi:sialate O-acetylesterase
MKKAKLILFLTIANLLFVNLSYANVKLPAIVSSNMVLQRNTTINLWGWADANEKISIEASWMNQVLNIEADDKGGWSIHVQTTNSKEPQIIKIVSESSNIILENILFGEVWLCSGQSNMEMPVKGYNNQPVNGSLEAIINAANSNIRLFTVKKNASLIPLEDVAGEWLFANPQSVKDFSAVGYFFGKKLNALLDIPIGLIHTSWGASKVEAWMDEETISEFGKIEIAKEIPEKYPQHSPVLLYNGMLHPLQNYSIKGVVWYQGESNITNADEYLRLFPAMVKQWRNQWQQGKLPFYYVQIAPFKYWGNNPVYLREAQLKCIQLIENSGMVVTLDIGDCEFIHPPEKRIIGDRLAYWALLKDYGFEGIACSGPVYKKFEITQDGKINLFFDNCPNGLSSFGVPLSGFEIAGNDKIFHRAAATINENRTVTVFSEEVANPVAARYAFIHCPVGTLFNIEGLPASSFRTDDWDE